MNNDYIKEAENKTITGSPNKKIITYDQLVSHIDEFLSSIEDFEYRQTYIAGKSKYSPDKLTYHSFINGVNSMILDYIRSNIQDTTTSEMAIINQYFTSCSDLSKIVNNTHIKVADNRLLLYITGYMINLLKHFNRNENTAG